MNYSVLMSVYHKDNADFLRMAMNSIWNQTVQTNDFVLVCDGPLSKDLDSVIEEMESSYAGTLHVFRLEKNSGLGNALNYGIQFCKNELVARMDSDDISRPDRCEKQISVFDNHQEISICSGTIEEFSDSTAVVTTRRMLPEKHQEIVRFAKNRNPFNHPCVMYRKSAVEAAGSYLDFYLLEDYYLWIRMLLKGYKGYNLQEPLLYMRAGADLYKRRSGWKYAVSQRKLFLYMKKNGFINNRQYLKSVLIRSCSSFAPNWIRENMFKVFVRRRP